MYTVCVGVKNEAKAILLISALALSTLKTALYSVVAISVDQKNTRIQALICVELNLPLPPHIYICNCVYSYILHLNSLNALHTWPQFEAISVYRMLYITYSKGCAHVIFPRFYLLDIWTGVLPLSTPCLPV